MKRSASYREQIEQKELEITSKACVNILQDILDPENFGKIVVLTGAGISTIYPTSLPTFSGKDGAYTKNPHLVKSMQLSNFVKTRGKQFYSQCKDFYGIDTCKTNIAHKFLAELQHIGIVQTIITQNIDNLHSKALKQSHCDTTKKSNAPKTIIDLHGNITADHCCTKCEKTYSYSEIKSKVNNFAHDHNANPQCSCGGSIKPSIIFYGENPDEMNLEIAKTAIKSANILIIIGTALKVSPAALLPQEIIENDEILTDKKIYLFNNEATYLDRQFKNHPQYQHIYLDLGCVFNHLRATFFKMSLTANIISREIIKYFILEHILKQPNSRKLGSIIENNLSHNIPTGISLITFNYLISIIKINYLSKTNPEPIAAQNLTFTGNITKNLYTEEILLLLSLLRQENDVLEKSTAQLPDDTVSTLRLLMPQPKHFTKYLSPEEQKNLATFYRKTDKLFNLNYGTISEKPQKSQKRQKQSPPGYFLRSKKPVLQSKTESFKHNPASL